jgi:hypothetical protein
VAYLTHGVGSGESWFRCSARQTNGKDRPAVVSHADVSTVLRHQLLDESQTQAARLPVRFGRKAWLEDLRE